ncbi:hypothetical protein SCHPADRAFT_944523 [Schizopora paradoxa]|uniref:Uncharacterized protein n=1 Tax=Schizopora paradoxa TaxID=27342 RepID=A0A0H2R900_9AGAM|nr:hypothetical protein SCHPADRAFT_944523 [Schizopora paradoxa]
MLLNLKSIFAVASLLSVVGLAIATPVDADADRHRDDSTGSTGSVGSTGSTGGGGAGGAPSADPLASVLSLLGLWR